jgi:crotonyl-CoA reductase
MPFRGAASPDELARIPVPDEDRAAHLCVEDVDMFSGVEEEDVRTSIRVGRVPKPDEVLVAVQLV